MKNKYLNLLFVISSLLVLSLVTSFSYAYFNAKVKGNDTAYETVITSGQMSLLLNDGTIVALNSALPGSSITKTFKVKNTGTVATTYDVYLSELVNTFVDKNDLVYTLTSETGCQTISETVVPNVVGEQSKIVSSCSINPNMEHEYTLNITFKEDNTIQDDNKGKIFNAKISLNEYKEHDSIVTQIIEKKSNGATDLEYDGVETLGELGTTDNNLRYIGATPNNYIYFNCSTTDPSQMNDTTCEKWRIIGVMNNIEDENENSASRLKIMRDELLGGYSWDTSTEVYGWGYNQWGPSTYSNGNPYEGADLMRELNTDYLGNITVGTDGKWYNGPNNKKTSNMPSTILNTNFQYMIETVKWNLGSPTNNEGAYDENWQSTLIPITSYERERSNYNGKTAKWSYTNPDNLNRTTTWIGKIALMYPSDYGYSTSGGNTISRETCLNTSMGNWNNNSECYNGTWISNANNQWLLSPFADKDLNFYPMLIKATGEINYFRVVWAEGVRPALFLQTYVSIVSGDGSLESPYKLTI